MRPNDPIKNINTNKNNNFTETSCNNKKKKRKMSLSDLLIIEDNGQNSSNHSNTNSINNSKNKLGNNTLPQAKFFDKIKFHVYLIHQIYDFLEFKEKINFSNTNKLFYEISKNDKKLFKLTAYKKDRFHLQNKNVTNSIISKTFLEFNKNFYYFSDNQFYYIPNFQNLSLQNKSRLVTSIPVNLPKNFYFNLDFPIYCITIDKSVLIANKTFLFIISKYSQIQLLDEFKTNIVVFYKMKTINNLFISLDNKESYIFEFKENLVLLKNFTSLIDFSIIKHFIFIDNLSIFIYSDDSRSLKIYDILKNQTFSIFMISPLPNILISSLSFICKNKLVIITNTCSILTLELENHKVHIIRENILNELSNINPDNVYPMEDDTLIFTILDTIVIIDLRSLSIIRKYSECGLIKNIAILKNRSFISIVNETFNKWSFIDNVYNFDEFYFTFKK